MEIQDMYKKAIEDGSKSDGKADVGKVRTSLLQVQFGDELMDIAKVLTFGANKYPAPPKDDSWRHVPNGMVRYTDALYRHLNAFLVDGESNDAESGLPHLAHAMCNLLFIRQLCNDDASVYKNPVGEKGAIGAQGPCGTSIALSSDKNDIGCEESEKKLEPVTVWTGYADRKDNMTLYYDLLKREYHWA